MKTQKKQVKKNPPIYMWIGFGVVGLIFAVILALSANPSSGVSRDPGQISVDKDFIDFGDLAVGTPVETTVLVKNNGTGVLEFSEKPYIEIKEGC